MKGIEVFDITLIGQLIVLLMFGFTLLMGVRYLLKYEADLHKENNK